MISITRSFLAKTRSSSVNLYRTAFVFGRATRAGLLGLSAVAVLVVGGCQTDNTSAPEVLDVGNQDRQPLQRTGEAFGSTPSGVRAGADAFADDSVAPAPAPAPLPPLPDSPAEQPAAQRTHTVATGDTLWTLAVRYYGRGNDWPKIVAANPGLDPSRMRIGQQLVIP